MAIYMVIFFSFFFTMMHHVQQQQPELMPEMFFQNIGLVFGFAILMMLCTLGLLIYFIIHVVNNTVIDSTERIIWVLVFIFAGMIGFPVYWYMRIWKAPLPVSNYS